jgi:hypothetical protein
MLDTATPQEVDEQAIDVMPIDQRRGTLLLRPQNAERSPALAELDPIRIEHALRHLRSTQAAREIFGANGHGFVLNPTLSEDQVSAFEIRHRVRLPDDYRKFLLHVGNGGAGPYYGIFPLGQMDGIREHLKPWHESDGFIGVLSEPFTLTNDWNDLSGMPSDDLRDDDVEYEKQFDEFEKRYWGASLMNGVVPICHEGCALRIWIVVTGEHAGRLWRDRRAEYMGVEPMLTAEGSPTTFSRWYNEWLDRCIGAAST